MTMTMKRKAYDIGSVVNGWTAIDLHKTYGTKKLFKWRHNCGYEVIANSSAISAGKKCLACGVGIKTKNTGTNICFDCENACGNCSWSKNFTPVEGWTAIRITRNTPLYSNGKRTYIEDHNCYYITDCPNFVKSVRRKCQATNEL